MMRSFSEFLEPLLQTNDYTISPLAGDASNRRYYRVIAGQKSWVLMEWDPFENPESFPFLSVQNYFTLNGIRVPQVYKFSPTEGLFLLEDLGDLTLERRFWEFQNQEIILPFYQNTLDQLIRIHSLSFQSDVKKTCTAYGIEFSVEKLVWELNYAKKYLLKELMGLSFSASDEAALEQEFIGLCQELYKSPQVICHRDFHSRNVMLHFQDVVIIDFQDARLGPPVYDLVSLLCDSYVELNQGSVNHLLDYYKSNFVHFDSCFKNWDQFMGFYNLQVIQRCFKACGSFASFKVMRNDTRYLAYIQPTLQRVHDQLKVTGAMPRLERLLSASESEWRKI